MRDLYEHHGLTPMIQCQRCEARFARGIIACPACGCVICDSCKILQRCLHVGKVQGCHRYEEGRKK